MSLKISNRSPVPIFLVATFTSAKMSDISRKLPFESLVSIFNFAKAFVASFGGPAKRVMMLRNEVPACVSRILLLPNSPVMAVACSILAPYAFAIGATYFMVSPKPSTLVAVRFVPFKNTSLTRPISLAARPNPLSVPTAICAARSNSTLPASASCKVPPSDL